MVGIQATNAMIEAGDQAMSRNDCTPREWTVPFVIAIGLVGLIVLIVLVGGPIVLEWAAQDPADRPVGCISR